MKFFESIQVNIHYFCNENLQRGTVLSTTDGVLAKKFSKGDRPIGLSMVDVVSVDTLSARFVNPHLQICTGSKIQILEIGTVTQYLNPSFRLPVFQPIYVNTKNGKLTWRNLGPMVGETLTSQNKDGHVNIALDFTRTCRHA